MSKKTAIYARVSSIKQKEGDNIQSQVSALIEYADKCDYDVPNGWIFKDDGVSGSTLERPALESLREIVYEGLVDVVLVYSPDRLSRKYAYQLILEMEFQKKNVELIFLNTPKAQNPEEQLSLHFKSIFAEYERAQIIERCRRGRNHRARQGSVSVISTAPFGYTYISKSATSLPQYIVNENSIIVKKIFSYYTKEYLSISKICQELENSGIPSPKGNKKWALSTVRDILRNEAYNGTAYFGKTQPSAGVEGKIYRTAKGEKRTKAKSATTMKPKELWIPIKVPQIILENDFELAQRKLEENIRTASRNTRQPSILQGLLICGHCGGPYYKKVRSKYSYYCCRHHLHGNRCSAPTIKQAELDNIVWMHVMDLMKNPRLIEDEMQRRVQENPDTKKFEENIKTLDKELLRMNKARDKILDAYQDGESLTLDELKGRLKAMEMKCRAISRDKKALEDLVFNEQKVENMKGCIEGLRLQIENAENLAIGQKQNILRLLVSEIVIKDNQINIRHCIPCDDDTFCDFSPLTRDGYAAAVGINAFK